MNVAFSRHFKIALMPFSVHKNRRVQTEKRPVKMVLRIGAGNRQGDARGHHRGVAGLPRPTYLLLVRIARLVAVRSRQR
jgi:hypothetical protein